MLGKHLGSIKAIPHAFLFVVRNPFFGREDELREKDPTYNKKKEPAQYSKYFMFSKYNNNEEEAKKAVEEHKIEKSNEFGFTQNQIRFLDKNTIEVKLTQDKIMVTDAKFIPEIEGVSLQAVEKKVEGDQNRYYAYFQIKKERAPFTQLITKYKIVNYLNGNTLDLRSANMREFGAIDDNFDQEFEDYSKYYDMPIEELPHNKWILGYLNGTTFERNTTVSTITSRVKRHGQPEKSKTFNYLTKYTKKEAEQEAKKWRINASVFYGTMQNMIRILNDDVIEVRLNDVGHTNTQTMITDKIFLPLFQIITLARHSAGFDPLSKTYAEAIIRRYSENASGKAKHQYPFHRLITGFSMVDHINHNPLDNRLINLQLTDASLNGSNRETNSENVGVEERSDHGHEACRARVKAHGHQYEKYFYYGMYGKEKAMELAIFYRKNIMEINYDRTDPFHPEINYTENDIRIIKAMLSRLIKHADALLNETIFVPTEYIKQIKLDDSNEKKCIKNMHSYNHIDT